MKCLPLKIYLILKLLMALKFIAGEKGINNEIMIVNIIENPDFLTGLHQMNCY